MKACFAVGGQVRSRAIRPSIISPVEISPVPCNAQLMMVNEAGLQCSQCLARRSCQDCCGNLIRQQQEGCHRQRCTLYLQMVRAATMEMLYTGSTACFQPLAAGAAFHRLLEAVRRRPNCGCWCCCRASSAAPAGLATCRQVLSRLEPGSILEKSGPIDLQEYCTASFSAMRWSALRLSSKAALAYHAEHSDERELCRDEQPLAPAHDGQRRHHLRHCLLRCLQNLYELRFCWKFTHVRLLTAVRSLQDESECSQPIQDKGLHSIKEIMVTNAYLGSDSSGWRW